VGHAVSTISVVQRCSGSPIDGAAVGCARRRACVALARDHVVRRLERDSGVKLEVRLAHSETRLEKAKEHVQRRRWGEVSPVLFCFHFLVRMRPFVRSGGSDTLIFSYIERSMDNPCGCLLDNPRAYPIFA
jgi:hypothetical protein